MAVTLTERNAGVQRSASGVAAIPELSAPEWTDYAEHGGICALVASLQPLGDKTPAQPLASGVCERGASAEGGPYLDTTVATSLHRKAEVWTGSTLESIEENRNSLRKKQFVSLYYSLNAIDRGNEAKAIAGCKRSFQVFRFPCGTHKLIPVPCNHIFCQDCATRRSKPLQDKLLKRVNTKKYSYFFLTLTVPNWDDLSKTRLQKELIRPFAALRRSDGWKKEVRGGVYSIEATFNRVSRQWHPHIHAFLECRGRLPDEWLGQVKAAWLRLTGARVLHLNRVYGYDRRGKKRRHLTRKSLRELVKYATKAASFCDSPDRVNEFLDAFENVRRVQSWGSFQGFAKEAEARAKEEETPKSWEPAGCKCGLCTWAMAERGERVHISQTVLFPDGTRQLRLFDSGSDPPEAQANGTDNRSECDSVAARSGQGYIFAPQRWLGLVPASAQ